MLMMWTGSCLPWLSYLGTCDLWEKTLQNWQSKCLAGGVTHRATGVEG